MSNFLHTIAGKITTTLAGFIFLLFSSVSGAHTATKTQNKEQTAAVVVATQKVQLVTNEATTTSLKKSVSSVGTKTVANQQITQPFIERIIQTPTTSTSEIRYVSESELNAQLSNLKNDFTRIIYGSQSGSSYSGGGLLNTVSLMSKIDSLSGTNLSNITVNGVSGLKASDIPALSYLSSSGGTVSGDLMVTGNFNLSGAQTLFGAIMAPYIIATSSTASTFVQASSTRFSIFDQAYLGGTATSTFDSAGKLSLVSDGLSVGTSQLVVSGGNVGIGTTSPTVALDIYGTTNNTILNITASAKGAEPQLVLNNASNTPAKLFIGSSSWHNNKAILYSSGADFFADCNVVADSDCGQIRFYTNAYYQWVDSPKVVISNTGKVGVGTTTPWRTVSVKGTVGFDGLTGAVGAGSLCLSSNKEVVYNSGSDNCLSSLRSTKHEINALSIDALSKVATLEPVSFIYNDDASSTVRYGFIAEDVSAVDTHLGTYDQEGNLSGVDDRAILAVIVRALKEILQKISETAHLIIATLTARRVETQELCVDGTCITGDQFRAIINQSGQQSAFSEPITQATTTQSQSVTATSTESVSDATTTSQTTNTLSSTTEESTK